MHMILARIEKIKNLLIRAWIDADKVLIDEI